MFFLCYVCYSSRSHFHWILLFILSSSIYSFCLSIYSFTYVVAYVFVCLLINSFIYSFIYLLIYLILFINIYLHLYFVVLFIVKGVRGGRGRWYFMETEVVMRNIVPFLFTFEGRGGRRENEEKVYCYVVQIKDCTILFKRENGVL